MFDTMVFTKALAAVCGALLIFLLGKWAADVIYQPGSRHLEQAYVIDVGEDAPDVEAEEELSFEQALAVADADAGAQGWGQCRACHQIEEERNGVGPHLVEVMGREIASVEGFNYSGSLPEGETWDAINMGEFLADPRGWAPGTSMAFAGIGDTQDRANMVAYLARYSPEFEMPEPPAEEAEAPAEEAVEDEDVAVEAPADAAPIVAAFAEADVDNGAGVWRQCQACHVADSEDNRVGPHLYDILDREIGVVEDFRYSGNLPEGAWTLEELDAFLEDPGEYAPGTTMAYGGLGELQDRADVIAYMVSVGPEGAREEAPVEEAPVEEPAEPEAPDEEAVEEEAVEEDEAALDEAPAEEESAIAAAYAEADAEAGSGVWRQCQACHVADSEQNRVGPHLVGMQGREIGSVEGFRYSGNLPEGEWTLEELDAFLEDPREYAPGTTMAFGGVRDLQDRANLIAYIESVRP